MIRIAACDDHSTVLLLLEEYLDRLASDVKEYIDVETFLNGRSLCAALNKGKQFDLLLLDIELHDRQNGLELCQWIRAGHCANPNIPVIFLSGKEGYEKELIRFYPLYFIPKPFDYQTFFDVVSKALKLEAARQIVFEYSAAHEAKRIPIRDILYFESKGRRISLISTSGTDVFYGKLDLIQEELKNTSFLRIHKSYLINTDHVTAIQFDSMKLWNGVVLPISQSKQKAIRQILSEMKDE